MKKRFLSLLFTALVAGGSVALADDNAALIVTNDGETLTVYNIDYSPQGYVYYSSTPDDADLQRIKKEDVLIIKLADGTKINPDDIASGATAQNSSKSASQANQGRVEEPGETHEAQGDFFVKKGQQQILVTNGRGQILKMRMEDEGAKTLAVIPAGKDMEYDQGRYVIPQFVKIGDDTYTVVQIDNDAFKNIGFWKNDTSMTELVLPPSIKHIGDYAFAGREGIRTLVLPEGIESVGEGAFARVGCRASFQELYIPKGIKSIGKSAFWCVGPNTSYRGFFQGNLTSMPNFITTGNCKDFGIDEEAVEAYYARYGR